MFYLSFRDSTPAKNPRVLFENNLIQKTSAALMDHLYIDILSIDF